MTSGSLFALGGLGLVVVGLHGLVLRPHLLHKVLAVNIMGSGVFLMLVALGQRGPAATDPVPQAMVITGIVVAVSATALALSLVLRLAQTSGQPRLPEDTSADDPGR